MHITGFGNRFVLATAIENHEEFGFFLLAKTSELARNLEAMNNWENFDIIDRKNIFDRTQNAWFPVVQYETEDEVGDDLLQAMFETEGKVPSVLNLRHDDMETEAVREIFSLAMGCRWDGKPSVVAIEPQKNEMGVHNSISTAFVEDPITVMAKAISALDRLCKKAFEGRAIKYIRVL